MWLQCAYNLLKSILIGHMAAILVPLVYFNFSNLAYLLILILTTPISDNKKTDLLPTAAEIVHVNTTWIQSVESHID